MKSQDDQNTAWTAYDQFQQRPRLQEYYHSINYNNVAAIQSLGISRFTTAVDLAAGCGTSTYPLLQVADSVIGVDSSSHLIALANQNNTDPRVRFICERAEEFRLEHPAGVVSASWLLNYFHSESSLQSILQTIHSLLTPDGCVSFVVPSAAFFSPQVQRLARDAYDFEVAALSDNGHSTVGIFSYGNEWIRTTVWQPLHLMRLCRPWFDLREWDVKGTLVRDNLLPDFYCEPPYTVLYGKKKGGA